MKILELVTKNSILFRELSEMEKGDAWAFEAVQDIILDVHRMKKPRSIDEAIKNLLEGQIVDSVVEGAFNKDDEAIEWILKFSKVKWVRERTIREIESVRIDTRQAMNILDELAKKLEQLH